MEKSFELLEEKVHKAAGLVKRLRGENMALREELGQAQARLQQAEKSIAASEKGRSASADEARQIETLGREVKGLRLEREEVRSRIAKLVGILEALD